MSGGIWELSLKCVTRKISANRFTFMLSAIRSTRVAGCQYMLRVGISHTHHKYYTYKLPDFLSAYYFFLFTSCTDVLPCVTQLNLTINVQVVRPLKITERTQLHYWNYLFLARGYCSSLFLAFVPKYLMIVLVVSTIIHFSMLWIPPVGRGTYADWFSYWYFLCQKRFKQNCCAKGEKCKVHW